MSRPFSVHSRGDRVRGRVGEAPAGQARPLVIVCGPEGSAHDPGIEICFRRFGAFAVVAAIDLPLCGARSSEKLSQAAFDPQDQVGRTLWPDLVTQARADLEQARRWLVDSPGVDGSRVALVGFGRGAELAREFCEASTDLACSRLEAGEQALDAVEAALRQAFGVG